MAKKTNSKASEGPKSSGVIVTHPPKHVTPGNASILWLVVMMALIGVVGGVSSIVLWQRQDLDNQIEAQHLQSQDVFFKRVVRQFRDKIVTLGKREEPKRFMPLMGTFTPYAIVYPTGWHVMVQGKDDSKTQTTTFTTGFYQLPIVSIDGGDSRSPDIELVDKALGAKDDKAKLLEAQKLGLKGVSMETIIQPAGSVLEVYRFTAEAEEKPEPKGPYTSLYKYVVFYPTPLADGKVENRMLVASVVTQETPAGLAAPLESRQALDEMVKSFTPASR